MNFCKSMSTALQTFDFFAAPIFLRYNAQQQKKTKTGGCISIVLIIILISAFSSSWIAVFGKTTIQCQYQTTTEMDPSPFQLNISNFAIAVGFNDINIIDENNKKYFDIIFQIQVRQNGIMKEIIPIEMVQCSQQHLKNYTINYKEIYYKFHLNKFLCLPNNFTLQLQGKWVSQRFTTISINVTNCTSNCVTNAQFEQYLRKYGQFKIRYYFMNTLLNPTLNQPLSIYFEDKYSSIVTNQITIQTNLYISQYEIETDQSLFPISSIQTLKGIYVDRSAKQQFIHSIQTGSYALFYFRKSDQKLYVSRVYRKLDDLFSYLGGLFGILASVFGCILIDFNKCCYELQMANKLFKSQNQSQIKKQDLTTLRQAIHCAKGSILEPSQQKKSSNINIHFNFLTYIKLILSKILFCFISEQNWRSMKIIKDKLQQTQNQMNIDIILQKIQIYEKAFQCIFTQNQMILLMLQQKISIDQLKQQRMIMNLQDQQFIQKYSKIKSLKTHKAIQIKKSMKTDQVKQQEEEDKIDKVMIQIYDAIGDLKKKQSQGDQISKNILLGIREDILAKYQKYVNQNIQQNTNKNIRQRTVNFTKFRTSSKKLTAQHFPIQTTQQKKQYQAFTIDSNKNNNSQRQRTSIIKNHIKLNNTNKNVLKGQGIKINSTNTLQL